MISRSSFWKTFIGNITLLVFPIMLFCSFSQECKPDLTQAYIDSTQVIAIVYFPSSIAQKNALFGTVEKVYKGALETSFLFRLERDGFKPDLDVVYLMYASGKNNSVSINSCSRTAYFGDAQADIEFLDDHIPCSVAPSSPTGACPRDLSQVCGCGKTYGNVCEAMKAGIRVYTFGACPEKK